MQSDSQENQIHHAIHGICTMVLAVSSLVLVKRIEKCSPRGETDNEKNQRQTIMVTSSLVVAFALIRTLTASFSKLKSYHKFTEGLYFLLALVLSITNIVYLSNVNNLSMCTVSGNLVENLIETTYDTSSNKNLSVFVLIFSIVVLVFLVKKAIWYAGTYKKSAAR
jgi:hypothetical protein